MSYVLAGAVVISTLILVACTLVSVDVSSGDEGHSEIHPNGVNVTVYEEEVKQAAAPSKGQQP